MKIALLTPNFPPEKGACASRMYYLAQQLRAAGHQVEVITVLPNYPTSRVFEAYRFRFFVHESQDHLSVRRYPVFASHSASWFFRLSNLLSIAFSTCWSYFFLRRWQPDAIVVQSPPLFLAVTGFLLARSTRARFWLNLSDLHPQALLDLGILKPNTFAFRILKKIETLVYQKAQLIICQSLEIQQFVQTITEPRKTTLYRTGVDTALFGVRTLPNNRSSDRFRVVYAGLLGLAQGMLELCQQLRLEHAHAELHLYGEGHEQEPIARWLRQQNHPFIFLHPAVPPAEVPSLLQQYDAALVVQKAYLYGTVPAKIYEAVSVGLPVLLMGSGESADLIRKHELGLVAAPKDYTQLITNLLILKNTPKTAEQQQITKRHEVAVRWFDKRQLTEKLISRMEEELKRG